MLFLLKTTVDKFTLSTLVMYNPVAAGAFTVWKSPLLERNVEEFGAFPLFFLLLEVNDNALLAVGYDLKLPGQERNLRFVLFCFSCDWRVSNS